MKKLAGYTLIELLMGLAIIGIVFAALGFASYRDYIRRQRVDGVQRDLISDLRIAQKNAASGIKPGGCAGVFAGFSFDTASCSGNVCTQYTLSAVCGSGPSILFKSVSIVTGVTISKVNSPILFKSLSAGTDMSSSQIVISLVDTVNARTDTVTVLASGEIK